MADSLEILTWGYTSIVPPEILAHKECNSLHLSVTSLVLPFLHGNPATSAAPQRALFLVLYNICTVAWWFGDLSFVCWLATFQNVIVFCDNLDDRSRLALEFAQAFSVGDLVCVPLAVGLSVSLLPWDNKPGQKPASWHDIKPEDTPDLDSQYGLLCLKHDGCKFHIAKKWRLHSQCVCELILLV